MCRRAQRRLRLGGLERSVVVAGVLLGVVLAAACGASDAAAARPPTATGTPPAAARSAAAVIEGFLVHRAGVTKLCEALLESYPPQCGGPSVRVEGLRLESVAGLDTAQGVMWSNQLVRLVGRINDGVLTVTAVGGNGPVALSTLATPAVVTGRPSGDIAALQNRSRAATAPSASPAAGSEGKPEPPDTVEGFLVHHDGVTRLCAGLLESYPPQCGGPSVRVEDLRLDTVAGLHTAENVTWSNNVVRLSGRLSDGVLTVTAVGGGAPAPLPAKPTPTAGDSGATAAIRNPDAPAAAGASSSSSSDSSAAAPSPPAGQQGNEEPDDVEGHLVHRNGVTRLCELLAESYPPQCGGSSVRVEGLDLNSVAGLTTAEGVTWSDDLVRLTGRLRDGVLTVS